MNNTCLIDLPFRVKAIVPSPGHKGHKVPETTVAFFLYTCFNIDKIYVAISTKFLLLVALGGEIRIPGINYTQYTQ